MPEQAETTKASKSAVIVEDNLILGKYLKHGIEQLGYRVAAVVVESESVVATVKAEQPDLILLDIHLGGSVDGIDLCEQIETISEAAVVFISGRADDETFQRVAMRRTAAFIVKPFTDAQLKASVLLAESRAKQIRHPGSVPDARVEEALRTLESTLSDLGVVHRNSAPEAAAVVPGIEKLSKREWDIIRAVLKYDQLDRVAERLDISAHTARNHLKSIYKKLNVRSKLGLVTALHGRPELREEH